MVLNKEHYARLERLAALGEAGKLTSVIEWSYSLAQVPDAVSHLEAGKVRGKVVITI